MTTVSPGLVRVLPFHLPGATYEAPALQGAGMAPLSLFLSSPCATLPSQERHLTTQVQMSLRHRLQGPQHSGSRAHAGSHQVLVPGARGLCVRRREVAVRGRGGEHAIPLQSHQSPAQGHRRGTVPPLNPGPQSSFRTPGPQPGTSFTSELGPHLQSAAGRPGDRE